MALLGIDVSEFQGRPDWRAVAASGVVFAFARVRYGQTRADTSYAYNRSGIRAAGIIPGAYHFLTSTSPADAQAKAFVADADPDAIHALDVEAAGLDVVGWIAAYRRFYPSKPLVIYTGRDLWRNATRGAVLGGPLGPLWVAGAVPNAYVPGTGTLAVQAAKVGGQRGGVPFSGWSAYSFMQFTDSARVPGITGNVDGDLFTGTFDQLKALTGTGETPAAPTRGDTSVTDSTTAAAVWHQPYTATPAEQALGYTKVGPSGQPEILAEDRLFEASAGAAAVAAFLDDLGGPQAAAALIKQLADTCAVLASQVKQLRGDVAALTPMAPSAPPAQ